jgi:FMN phosphatase YigB (HAD superfamily)
MYGAKNLSRPKTIAFDFDETISDHPTLFLSVMETFRDFNWNVVVVTYRQPDCFPEDLDFLKERGYKVYFTGQKAKEKFMSEQGITVDIWVDDAPRTIVQSFDARSGDFYEDD